MNKVRVLRDLELDENQLHRTQNFLSNDKREFIRQILTWKLKMDVNPVDYINQLGGNLIGGAIAVLINPMSAPYASNKIFRSFNPINMIEESMKKINEITKKIPPDQLVSFHRECVNQDLDQTIQKWYKRLPIKPRFSRIITATRSCSYTQEIP